MESEFSMVITTCETMEDARRIARLLVEKHLAACVQMFPIESVYIWKNRICEEKEILILIKSKASLFDNIKGEIRENHPYEVPEIILLPVMDGLPEYLKWICDATT